MKYLICYVWNSTRGNHAGMAHMCDLLKENWPEEYEVIKFYQEPDVHFWPSLKMNRYTKIYFKRISDKLTWIQINWMLKNLKDGDSVYLLEYLFPTYDDMRPIAKRVRAKNLDVKIFALAHLTPSYLMTHFNMNADELAMWSSEVNKMMTLGSSLSNFFVDLGVPKESVVTLFHYVDLDYYKPTKQFHEGVQIMLQGNLQRNFNLVERVVAACPQVKFTLCTGRLSLPQFAKYSNVKLLGYVSEKELKQEMDCSDISLNIMDDTVGSNVITTSLSMGLAMVVSDVGSIRDYCDDTNSVFCKTDEDFIVKIKELVSDKEKIALMKKSSLEKAKQLSIEKFHTLISCL